MKKKVLVLTYYWPPAGGPGVQRVLKFVKYMPQLDWHPIILTVKDGEYLAIDQSLENEIPESAIVYKSPLWEPSKLYKKIVGLPDSAPLPVGTVTEETDSIKKRILSWIRLNCFIPDAKMLFPFQFYKKAREIIKKHQPNIIFSSAPPPSIHLLAYRLHKWSQLPWVADFRDPWTNIYYYKDTKRLFLSKKIDEYLEKKVLLSANERIAVGKNCARDLRQQEYKIHFEIIYNGFDPDDFKNIKNPIDPDTFYITYAGNLNQYRNPLRLWKDLSELLNERPELQKIIRVKLIGIVHPKIIHSIKEYNLQSIVELMGYLSHNDVLKELSKSALLLLPISRSKGNIVNVTGKIFEYLAAQRYIVGIGPKEGEAAKIIHESNSGKMFDYEESIKDYILKIFTLWKEKKYYLNNEEKILKYSRKYQTKQLVDIFEKVIREWKK